MRTQLLNTFLLGSYKQLRDHEESLMHAPLQVGQVLGHSDL